MICLVLLSMFEMATHAIRSNWFLFAAINIINMMLILLIFVWKRQTVALTWIVVVSSGRIFEMSKNSFFCNILTNAFEIEALCSKLIFKSRKGFCLQDLRKQFYPYFKF